MARSCECRILPLGLVPAALVLGLERDIINNGNRTLYVLK
jgi:hypothetical protein